MRMREPCTVISVQLHQDRVTTIYLEHISIEARGTRRDQDATRARVRAARCVLAFTGFVWRFGRTAPQRQIQVSLCLSYSALRPISGRERRELLSAALLPRVGWPVVDLVVVVT